MNVKWLGAILVISGCGGWGFSLAAAYIRQEKMLRKLCRSLKLMRWELQYRLTALPELCKMAAKECSGELRAVFLELGKAMEKNREPEVSGCMHAVLEEHGSLPPKVRMLLQQLGRTLGRYDLEGQLEGMDSVRQECETAIRGLGKDREIRLRSYQTLGLCAGAALAILFA